MAVSARWYPNGIKHFMAGDADWDANTIKVALVTSAYTPSGAHEFWASSVVANEASGTNYTAGGATLGSKTNTTVQSGSATAWAATTAYQIGDLVRATTDNGHVFAAVVAGTSGGSQPSWQTAWRRETTDGSVVWVEAGAAYISLDGANTSWANVTVTARYAVIYKTGTNGVSDYLLGLVDFGQNESAVAELFEIQWDNLGILIALADS